MQDFLTRGIIGLEQSSGAMGIAETLRKGQRLQFMASQNALSPCPSHVACAANRDGLVSDLPAAMIGRPAIIGSYDCFHGCKNGMLVHVAMTSTEERPAMRPGCKLDVLACDRLQRCVVESGGFCGSRWLMAIEALLSPSANGTWRKSQWRSILTIFAKGCLAVAKARFAGFCLPCSADAALVVGQVVAAVAGIFSIHVLG